MCKPALPVVAILLASCASSACAQAAPQVALLDNTAGYSAVSPSAAVAEEVGAFTSIANRVFKPKGDGPFAAIVLVHSCGGAQRPHIRTHAQDLVAAGFVVLVQDTFSPRGVQSCRERRIPFAFGVLDAYSGLSHLAALPFVRKDEVYLLGFSYGGAVASLASSAKAAEKAGSALRFRAAAAHYSNCYAPSGAALVLDDTDRPLLILMGDRDTETPAANCDPRLQQLRGVGVPVSWNIFSGATHGWDRPGESANGYTYNSETTRDAMHRTIAFFRSAKP